MKIPVLDLESKKPTSSSINCPTVNEQARKTSQRLLYSMQCTTSNASHLQRNRLLVASASARTDSLSFFSTKMKLKSSKSASKHLLLSAIFKCLTCYHHNPGIEGEFDWLAIFVFCPVGYTGDLIGQSWRIYRAGTRSYIKI